MNTIKEILFTSVIVLFLGTSNNIALAAQTGMTKPINDTITHIEAALAAVNKDDFTVAHKHINEARQTSKEIIGGTLAPKASRGSDAIIKARRYVKKDDKEATTAALQEALEIFKSMLSSADGGSQGGLK